MGEKILEILANWMTFGWKARRNSDIELYHRMKNRLPYNCDSILLLKEHDFSQSFPYEHLKPLNYVAEDWRDNEFKLHNFWVNRRKNKFLEALKKFLDELSLYSGMERTGLMSIGVNEVDKKERKNRLKVAKSINKLASESLKKYEKFIVVGKKRFHQ